MKNLVLIGFMGSGKTSAGKLAARRLGLTFVDMDHLIEQRAGQTVAHIFETQGEAAFRKQERALVRELAAGDGQIIATGGGVVLDPENVKDFSRTGIVVCLWVDAQAAYERTRHAKHRPLLEDTADRLARIEELLQAREPLYKAIPNQVDVSTLTTEQQADAIVYLYKQQTGV